MNNRRINIIMGLLVVLFMGVLVGCPTEAPKPKEKDAERGPCDVDYRYSPKTLTALKIAIDNEIGTNNTADLRYINVSGMTSMNGAFQSRTDFNGDLSCWNTSIVKSMNSMFDKASAFNQDIGGWDVSNVNDMSWMFSGASAFNNGGSESIGKKWNTGKVETVTLMFENAKAFNQDLSGWTLKAGVTHGQFDNGATAWTKPKPNFP